MIILSHDDSMELSPAVCANPMLMTLPVGSTLVMESVEDVTQVDLSEPGLLITGTTPRQSRVIVYMAGDLSTNVTRRQSPDLVTRQGRPSASA